MRVFVAGPMGSGFEVVDGHHPGCNYVGHHETILLRYYVKVGSLKNSTGS